MKKIINELTIFIKRYVQDAKSKGIIIGMSGGKDSFVTASLCVRAVGNENVYGVIMPDGDMKDIDIAKQECEILKIRYSVIDISKETENIKKETKIICDAASLNEMCDINIAPRIRMAYLYSVGAEKNYLVANTSNLSERMIGYSTKWGDAVGDFAPLADFTKTEVCEIGIALGLPENLVNKKPDDGLSGKTDEEKIGFTYSELDDFIRKGIKSENFEKIKKMFNNSKHKRNSIPKFDSNKINYLEN